MSQTPQPRAFPPAFDQVLHDPPAAGKAFFGRDVLRGLIEGIQREQAKQRSQRSERWWGTGVVGCAMWMDDPELLKVLSSCESTCVVVTKQARDRRAEQKYSRLRGFNADGQGLAQKAFPELADLEVVVDGKPAVVGPYDPAPDGSVGPIRELGFRKVDNELVPIVHAKIALLGQMRWTDDHPSGHLVDQLYFAPTRLWIGSANFTASSRRSLEMGMWTDDPELLAAARQFLLTLVAWSEPLQTGSDHLSPELAPVEYDDAAFYEALRDHRWDDDPEDPDD